MDVYLDAPCEPIYDVLQLDSLDCLPHRSILFIGWKEPQRDSLFAEWLDGREQTVVGNRSFTIVGQKKIRFKPLRIKNNVAIEQAKPVKLRIDTTKLKNIE
jgi:hypothetical protein